MLLQKKINIQKGVFLLSDPFLQDEYFGRSVILLCNHKIKGSFGYIINKPLTININEAVAGFPKFDAKVYYGGPVESNTLHYLHTIEELEEKVEIEKGIYWSGNYDHLKELIQLGKVEPNQIKFLLGYAGWNVGQIEEEMEEDSWIVAESNPDYIFNHRESSLWKDVLINMGGEFEKIAHYPLSPLLN